jgi:hypothetical protein
MSNGRRQEKVLILTCIIVAVLLGFSLLGRLFH